MTHFFEKRDRWGNSRAIWVLAAMMFVLPPTLWIVRTIKLENDVENWLPQNDPQARTLSWYREIFSPEEHVFVSWDGSSLFDPRVPLLANRLEGTVGTDGVRRNGVKQVDRVTTPPELLIRMEDEHIEPREAIRRLHGVLIGTGSMRVRLTDAGRRQPKTITRALSEQGQAELGIPIQVAQANPEWSRLYPVPKDIESELEPSSIPSVAPLALTTSGEPVDGPVDYDFEVSWSGIALDSDAARQFEALALGLRGFLTDDAPDGELLVDSCFFVPVSPVMLSLSLSDAGVEDRTGTFEAIRRVATEVGIDPETLHFGGRPVVRTALNQAVKQAAWNSAAPAYLLTQRSLMLSSCLVVAGLAFYLLKSVRLTILVLAVSVFTTLLAVAFVPLTGGSMNMVLVVMPPLLMTLTMSGAIHVANYWKHAATQNPETAIVESSKIAWHPCLLAGVTTAIGMASLASSSLTPVRDFGIYSAAGCLLSVLVVLYGLPSLLYYWPAKTPQKSEVQGLGWVRLGKLICTHRMLVIAGCVMLFAGSAYGLRYFKTETKVIRYFPDESRVVQDYRFLEQQLAGINSVDTIISFDQEMQKSSNFLERMEIVRSIEQRLREHPDISGALSLADFQPVSSPPPEGASFLQRARYNKKANAMEAKVKGELQANTRSLLVQPTRPGDLNTPGDRKLNSEGDELWRITAQAAVLTEVDYGTLTRDLNDITQSVLKYHPGSDHIVTGIVPVFLRTQQVLLDSLITSFALAFGVIGLLMMIMLRHPLSGLLTMLPNLLPVGVVFGILCWMGGAVDIGTMITASVALGIAVDGTLHLLTWFRSGIREGLSRQEAVEQALRHCGPAMFQTSTAISIGLILLAPSELLLISRFGWLMAALIGSALIADIIFLPALLAGPLGMLIQRSVRSTRPFGEEIQSKGPPKPHWNVMSLSESESQKLDA